MGSGRAHRLCAFDGCQRGRREKSTLPNKKPSALGKPLAGSDVQTPPEPSEIEVSLFGPGYGECLVLHLGDNTWIIVDSCIDPRTGEPVALAYLHHMHIDPATAVQQVIATHWHDDHIRGLGRIVQACASAEFVCSAALQPDEFLTLVMAYGRHAMMASPGVQEFYDVIQALQERSQHVSSQLLRPPVFASEQDTVSGGVMCIFLAHGILALSMPYLLLIPLSCLHIDTLPICSLERVSQNRAFQPSPPTMLL